MPHTARQCGPLRTLTRIATKHEFRLTLTLRARELAEAAREQIEQETWTPHRGRLLGHALTGLSTSKTRELSAQQSSALGLRDRLASGMGFRNWQLARERTHVVGAATGAQRRGGERAAGRGPSYRTSL